MWVYALVLVGQQSYSMVLTTSARSLLWKCDQYSGSSRGSGVRTAASLTGLLSSMLVMSACGGDVCCGDGRRNAQQCRSRDLNLPIWLNAD